MCDVVYLNHFSNFKQWYTSYGWRVGEGETTSRSNTVILTKVRVQSINDIAIHIITSKKFTGDVSRLGTVYVFDVTHNEALKTIFSR